MVKFIAIRLYTFGFIIAGSLAYLASAGVAGMGWVTDSITTQVIAMILQILLVSIMTYKSMGLLSYSPSAAPEMASMGGGGGGASGGGGGSSISTGEREADKLASPTNVAKGSGVAAKAMSMTAGAVGGGGLAAMQLVGGAAKGAVEGAAKSVAETATKGAGDALKGVGGGGNRSGGGKGGLSDALGGGRGKDAGGGDTLGGGRGSGGEGAGDALKNAGGGEGGGNRRQKGSRGNQGKGGAIQNQDGAVGGVDAGGNKGSGFDWTGGKKGLGAIAHGMMAGFKTPSLAFMDGAAGAANAMGKAAGAVEGSGKGGRLAAALANGAAKTAGSVAKAHAHAASMVSDMGAMAKKPFSYIEKNKAAVNKQQDEMKAEQSVVANTINEEPKKNKEQGKD